jgi:hypothetical protein
VLQNVDLEHMSSVSHFNIDKNNVLQGMVITDILAAASAPRRRPGALVTCMAVVKAAARSPVRSLMAR